MQTATITAKYVNEAKPGKKMGSVKTSDDQKYLAYDNLLKQMQRGQTYNVKWEQAEWADDELRVIKSFEPASSPATNGAAPAGRPSSQAKEIFVTGVVGRIGGTGAIQQPEEIKTWLKEAKRAWELIMEETAQDEPEDEIPY